MNNGISERVSSEIAEATHRFADMALGDAHSKVDILVIRNAMNIGARIALKHIIKEAEGFSALMNEAMTFKDFP